MKEMDLRLVLLALAASTAGACLKKAPAPEPAAAHPPAGQVWITPDQVKEAKIQVAPVGEQQVDDTIVTAGTVTLDDKRTGHVFSPVTGRVVTIVAGLGQRVKKGEPLATIESPDVGSAVSDVHKAEADLIAADHDLKRKKALFEQKAGSAADLETSEDTFRRAQAELERAQQKELLLRVGNADSVTQGFTLVSPVDGEVLMRNINPGIEVQGQYSGGSATELFTIGELDRVWVIADLYEMDIARVSVGTPASVSVVAYPGKTFDGKVDWVSGSLDATLRTTKVRCTFENPDSELRPMMYAQVQISVDRKRALAIPRSTLLRLGDQMIVFVRIGEANGLVQFQRVPVDVDEGESSPWLEVKSGLTVGQNVVVHSAILLSSML
jgi:cobalt-zinc-cadmium efflux system membrane fusion protein